MKDSVGDGIKSNTANWKFDENVVPFFDNHVNKSVPLYEEGHDLVIKIADFFLTDQSVVYEIGCSTGTLIEKLAKRNKDKEISIIGIDCENAMCDVAKEKNKTHKNVEIFCADALEIDLQKSDLIICYYTLQFIRPKSRQIIFDKIYQSLNWGGAFLLFEKVRAPDARFQDISTLLYNDFKLGNGYSEKEILKKSDSLKGVLEPFSSKGNLDLLKRSGFEDINSVMKYICFEGFLSFI